jgi:hypothetical protein
MTIENANDYLLEQGFPDYDIDYAILGERYKAYTQQDPKVKPANELLEQAIDHFSPERLFLVPRRPNGAVSRRLSPIEVEIPKTDEEPKESGLNGFSGYTQNAPATAQVPATGFDSYKDFIIRDLERKLDKAERKLEKQETIIDKLKEQKTELEKNVAFKDKEFELALQEKEGDYKNSLNGIVGSLKEPETLEALAGLANAIKEMRSPQAIELNSGELPEGIEAADLQNEYIYNVVLFMARSSDQVKQKIFETINRAVNKQQSAA